ncbi:hypothetical protein ACIOWE_04090 [Pseudomonas sp. NPDC087598]|uniref:hypothetical protein n=1 Tax=Pseudomonas sp. NPDC087598 TaxID=3364440 RepID=UPI0037F70B2D
MSNHSDCREFPGGNLLSSEDTYLNDKGNRIMSSINGTYVNANAGAKLTITDGNDSNGTFSGAFSQGGVNYDVSYGHYHFQNSTGQPTIITFAALNEGTGYQSWTLFSPDHNYSKVRAVGSRTNFDGDVVGLAGEFVKQ